MRLKYIYIYILLTMNTETFISTECNVLLILYSLINNYSYVSLIIIMQL